MSIKVNANLLRVAHMFVSTEQTRYYLNGVYIHRHQLQGVYLVATDGHRMMVAYDEHGSIDPEDGAIVKLDKTALAACKAKRTETGDRTAVLAENGTMELLDTDGHRQAVAMCEFIDGTFPDYRRVIREAPESNERAAFNGQYLADFGKAAAELTGRKSAPILVRQDGDNPAVINLGVDFAFGVIMPVRLSVTFGEGLPWFFTAAPAESGSKAA